MIALALAACGLGVWDALQSVKLQRTGLYIENGLPALLWGPRPSALQLVGSAVALCGALLAGGELGLAQLPAPWDTISRAALYGGWLVAEGWMVLRNIALLRRL